MSTIEQVDVQPLDLPLTEPFEISLGTQHEAINVLVRIETSSGVIGYGEGSPVPPVTGETQTSAIAVIEEAVPLLVDEPLADYQTLIRRVRETFPGMVTAQFAVETAILDAYCREIDLPLAALFGGGSGDVITDITIPMVDTEDARRRTKSALRRGFEELKIKTGGDLHADIARVAAVDELAPDAQFKVDANQGWSPKTTLEFVTEMQDRGIDIALVEQPVPKSDIDGLAYVQSQSPIPIAADEAVFTPADALRLIEENAADILNVKLGKSGLTGAATIAALAQAADLEVMIGCMFESAIGIRTSAHIAAGTSAFAYVDLDGNRLLAKDVVADSGGPNIPVTGPGHGVIPSVEK